MLQPELRHTEPIDEAERVLASESAKGGSERLEVRHVQAARVDAARAAHDDRRARRRAQDEWVQLLAARLGVLLRVVEAGERPARREAQAIEVEEDGGRDERARERTAACLVGAGDETALERAVEGEELAAGPLRAGLRAFRFGRAAST